MKLTVSGAQQRLAEEPRSDEKFSLKEWPSHLGLATRTVLYSTSTATYSTSYRYVHTFWAAELGAMTPR